jgi:hypothetical protein
MWEGIEELMEMFKPERIVGGNIFLELTGEKYDELIKETEEKAIKVLGIQTVPDIGGCTKVSHKGYTVYITYSKNPKTSKETMYVGFKTKVDDGVKDSASSQT